MAVECRTSLVRLEYLARRLGLPHVHAKCEAENPTATQKDRIADSLVRAALDAGAKGITAGSCGNIGVALALASRRHNLPCVIFVPRSYRCTRSDEMAVLGAEVVRDGATYETAVATSRLFARESGYFDANPIGQAGEIAIAAYGAIADEILAQCPVGLGSIWLPVGNGTCAASLHARLHAHGLAVRIGVVGSAGNTALTASLAASALIELDACELTETEVNEPLVNWFSLHAREAIAAVRDSGGYSCDATDAALLAARRDLHAAAGIAGTPAGAAGIVGLETFSRRLDPEVAHIVLLTA